MLNLVSPLFPGPILSTKAVLGASDREQGHPSIKTTFIGNITHDLDKLTS